MAKRTIHIAVFEPNEGSARCGGFEWSTDLETAWKAYRGFRGPGGTAFMFTPVTVPDTWSGGQISDFVDTHYWDGGEEGMRLNFGEPVLIYKR
jgi:hypothetical protein